MGLSPNTSRSVKWLKAKKKGEKAYRLVDRDGHFYQSIGKPISRLSIDNRAVPRSPVPNERPFVLGWLGPCAVPMQR